MLGLSLARIEGGGFRVKSVQARSRAEKIGFQSGDLLLGINGRSLEDADALRRAVLDLQGRGRAQVVVQRGGGRYHVTVPLS
jgi:type II secretory pathway component PulC